MGSVITRLTTQREDLLNLEGFPKQDAPGEHVQDFRRPFKEDGKGKSSIKQTTGIHNLLHLAGQKHKATVGHGH